MKSTGTGRVPVKVVAATVAGNALEFFDFVAYAFFAAYISKAFFPAKTELMSLLITVGVFGVGFVFRPLGGVLIGAYADRAGRKPAMLLTIAMITVGTAGLALTPSYESIGMAAPVIVILCRLIQGLALGGEVGPASVFLLEIAPVDRRGFYTSWQLASQGLSALLSGATGAGLALVLSEQQMVSWGWRVPFLLCLLLIPLAIFLRSAMPETLEAETDHDAARPMARLKQVLGERRVVILAILLILGGTISTYVANYLTTYAITILKLPSSVSLAATMVGGAGTFVFSLLGGWLSDLYGRRIVMLIPRLILTLTAWPMFILLAAHPTPAVLFAVALGMTALTALGSTASLTTIPELLPTPIRATGFAVAYAVGVSLFGGTTQFVITWLLDATKNPVSPAWYVTLASVITLVAMWLTPESRGRSLER
ncbi:MAG TPA: MFS transporter [Reyranella sp.]|nr:MFS transporter [Reyranella sp.]